MCAAADQRHNESECDIRAHHLSGQQGSKAQECGAAQSPRPGRRKPHLRAHRQHQPAKQRAAILSVFLLPLLAERIEQLPARRSHKNCPQQRVQQVLRSNSHKMLQEKRPDDHSRHTARKHIRKGPPRHIAAHDLRWHQNQFDCRRKHQTDSHGHRRGHSEKKNQNRHCNSTRANPGQRDEQCNDKSNEIRHSNPFNSSAPVLNRRRRFNVNSALNLAAGPTSRPRIVRIQWKRSTRLAAD